MKPSYRLRAASEASGVIATFTVAEPPAGTDTVGDEKTAVLVGAKNDKANVFGPVLTAFTFDRSYVAAVEPLFRIVSVCVPPLPSPSEILLGVTDDVASIAFWICTRSEEHTS